MGETTATRRKITGELLAIKRFWPHLAANPPQQFQPVRLRLIRAKGFDLHKLSVALNGLPAVNCARPGPLGNPFYFDATHPEERLFPEAAARVHRDRLLKFGQITNGRGRVITLFDITDRCARHNLACFCKLESPWCHCDTLLQVANGWPDAPPWSGFAVAA